MSSGTSKIIRRNVAFNSGKLALEGILHTKDQTSPGPAVVVCHPHPQFGGTMHNAVISLICDELVQHDITALRFNFRGVEGSQGAFDNAVGEVEDVRAALDFLCSLPASPSACALPFSETGGLGLAGYSFGAYVSAKQAAEDGRVKAVALVSPAVNHQDFSFFLNYAKPKLILSGERDELVPSESILGWAQRLQEPKQLELIPFADHFWLGFERSVAAKVAKFFREIFS